jgi:hypothetical protein
MAIYNSNSLHEEIVSIFGSPLSESVKTKFESAMGNFKKEKNRIGTFCLTNWDSHISVDGKYEGVSSLPEKIKVQAPGVHSLVLPFVMEHTIRNIIKQNLLIRTVNRNCYFSKMNVTPAEELARAALRDQITEAEWRRYVTNGFLMHQGNSKFWYQIFASNDKIKVYKDNKLTHQICLHSDPSVPPTDHVLNLKTLVEMDESLIWREGNISPVDPNEGDSWAKYLQPLRKIDPRPKSKLMQVFQYYKGA